MMVDKDVRRMSVKAKPDGTPPDMSRPADILIYEVRDMLCVAYQYSSLITSVGRGRTCSSIAHGRSCSVL